MMAETRRTERRADLVQFLKEKFKVFWFPYKIYIYCNTYMVTFPLNNKLDQFVAKVYRAQGRTSGHT